MDINCLVDEVVNLYFAGASWRKGIFQLKCKYGLWGARNAKDKI